MQKNETVLTPLYRYILGILEGNSKIDSSGLIQQIKQFKNHLQTTIVPIPEGRDDYLILDNLIELLEKTAYSESDGKIYWQNKLTELVDGKCELCTNCRSCKSYFWRELGEIFFDEVNNERENKKYLPVRRLPEEILRHLEPAIGMAELYYSQVKRRNKSYFINKLVLLKGMSSSTPPMLNTIFDTEEFVGGGFYFNWQGHGVVVDPGYSFVKNLHHYGLSLFDINTVVITHEHIDHNNDMRLLDELHFSVMRYEQQSDGNPHIINWYLDKVSYDIATTLQKNGSGFNSRGNILHCLKAGTSYELCEQKVLMQTFATEHIWNDIDKKYKDYTVGCKFLFKDGDKERTIVYTSDTRYAPMLSDIVKDANAVIANISGIYEDDYMLVKEKSTHLGYYGCYHLIKNCFTKYKKYPSFYFVSEFWNGKSDIRYDVAKCLRNDFRDQGIDRINVVPAEVGMIFDIENTTLQCSQCGRFVEKIIIKKPANIRTKVEALCSDCLIW